LVVAPKAKYKPLAENFKASSEISLLESGAAGAEDDALSDLALLRWA
jgi:hypothetical protein